MWTKELNQGYESRKCRNRVIQYLQGNVVFDLGCGEEKVTPFAVGIDLFGKSADLRLDLSHPNALYLFADDIADAVFSSHCLEHFHNTASILKEWWRIVKPGGYLILYLPHRDLYPADENPDHKHQFIPEDIINILDGFASYKLIVNQTHQEMDEYSFELIMQKIPTPKECQIKIIDMPTKTNTTKKVLIIRYGAVGDLVIITPLLKILKQDGYRATLNTVPDSLSAIDHNPNIDELLVQKRHIIPSDQLGEYHKEISKGFDRVINLCESIERTLLFEEMDKDKWNASKGERHRKANINYYDRTLELGGYPYIKGLNGELYISDAEESMIKLWKEKHKGFFKIMWQVRGSSDHKIYPYLWDIAEELTEKYDNIKVFLTGGEETLTLDWNNPNIRNCIGRWNIRQTLIMTSAMDLVISPETGVLNAAGCFPVPKIGLLTHSTKENLTKYFLNDYSIESSVPCAPCHKLMHNANQCEVDKEFGLPICMSRGIDPLLVKQRILSVYEN